MISFGSEAGGLAAAYGTLGGVAQRSLNSTSALILRQTLLGSVADTEEGVSTVVGTGTGVRVLMARTGEEISFFFSRCPQGAGKAVYEERPGPQGAKPRPPKAGLGDHYAAHLAGTPIGRPSIKMA